MRTALTPLTLLLLAVPVLACAQATKPEQDTAALALAVKSQRVLNEYAVGAVEPEAMKYAQRLRLTKAALDGQRKEWPKATSGADSSDSFRACKTALEQASYVAELSGKKAVSRLDDKVFDAEKGQLQKLRGECDAQVKRGR